MYTTLIDPASLAARLQDPSWVVVDCRFDLAAPDAGEQQFLGGHIPGARYAHLDRHLSGVKTGANGRHPLPEPEVICRRFSELGIASGSQVVAYDADSGMFAARLWWMLHWMGHDAAAVLDGGLARWQREGYAVRAGAESWTPAVFAGSPRPGWVLSVEEIEALVRAGARSPRLVDSRSPERYRGINETIDKVGGHIPGAANYFFQQNLTDDKRFKPADEIRRQWASILEQRRPEDLVIYCGSGVTACHNLLALEHAGIHGVRIYPGSWSEWSADPSRPIATDD